MKSKKLLYGPVDCFSLGQSALTCRDMNMFPLYLVNNESTKQMQV